MLQYMLTITQSAGKIIFFQVHGEKFDFFLWKIYLCLLRKENDLGKNTREMTPGHTVPATASKSRYREL